MIYLERRLELHLEGHGFFDLVRTGRALTVLKPFGIKEHMLIFLIPRNQVILVNNSTIFP